MTTELAQYSHDIDALRMETLARDVVLFGGSDLLGVLAAYDLTEESFLALLDTSPLLEQEIKRVRKQVEQDPKVAVRLAANEVLGVSIPHLQQLIASSAVEPKDRVKAIELAARLADALPRDTKSPMAGVAVQINFGDPSQFATVAPVNGGGSG